MIEFGKWTPSLGDFEAPGNVSDVDGMYPMTRGYEPWHSYQTARPDLVESANNAICIYGSASPQIAMTVASKRYFYNLVQTATSVWFTSNAATGVVLATFTNSGGNHLLRTSATVNLLNMQKSNAIVVTHSVSNNGTLTCNHGMGNSYSTGTFMTKVYLSATVVSEYIAGGIDVSSAFDADERGWSMDQFKGYVLVANRNCFPSACSPMTLGISALKRFRDLAAPFKAGVIGTIGEFVVCGDLIEDDLDNQTRNKIWWSAIGTPFDWAVDSATQCGNAILPGGSGEVRGIVSGEYGLILCANEIYRMLYVGLPTIFQITVAFRNIGVLCKHSWAQHRDMLFMATSTGFKMIIDGSVVHDIGKEDGIDDFFKDDLDPAQIGCIHCAVDGESTRVFWSYQSNRAGITWQDRILCYDWRLQKWSKRTDNDQSLVANIIYSDVITSGQPRIGIVDNTNSVILAQTATAFSSNENYVLETAEYEHNNGQRTFLKGIRPVYTGYSTSTPSVGVYHRDRFGAEPTITAPGAMNRLGEIPTRVNSRYMKYRINFEKKNFKNVLGIQVKASPGGTQ